MQPIKEKEKPHYFTHPAQNSNNSTQNEPKRKNRDVRKKGNPHREQEKVNKGKKQEES